MRTAVTSILRIHAPELRPSTVESLSVFGSTGRGRTTQASDVDIVVRLRSNFAPPGPVYFGKLSELRERLILRAEVDIVNEPVRKQGLREVIEQDRVRAI